MLAEEMQLVLPPPPHFSVPIGLLAGENNFLVPYTMDGDKSKDGSTTTWPLSEGSRVQICYGPGAGLVGTMGHMTHEGDYLVEFPRIVGYKDEWVIRRDLKKHTGKDPRAPRCYVLGGWWVESAVNGL